MLLLRICGGAGVSVLRKLKIAEFREFVEEEAKIWRKEYELDRDEDPKYASIETPVVKRTKIENWKMRKWFCLFGQPPWNLDDDDDEDLW